jgi:hypothetical protein
LPTLTEGRIPVDITPARRSRLDALMNERRLSLGMTWREVARSAGVSYEAVRAVRRGPGGIAELTARQLDKALQWEPGSIAAIVAGEQGEPAELPPQPSVTDLPPDIVREGLADPVIAKHVRAIWEDSVSRDQRLAMIRVLVEYRKRISGSGAAPAGSP